METVEELIKELKSDDCEIRWRAARALRWTKAASAVRPLIKAMGDSDCNVRWSAAESLVVIGEPAVHPLAAALKDLIETFVGEQGGHLDDCETQKKSIHLFEPYTTRTQTFAGGRRGH